MVMTRVMTLMLQTVYHEQSSSSVANHTLSGGVGGGQGASVGVGQVGSVRSGREKSGIESRKVTTEVGDGQVKSLPKSGDQSETGQGNSGKSGNQTPATYVNPPAPTVKPNEEILPGSNINERVGSGEATLEDVPVLSKAH